MAKINEWGPSDVDDIGQLRRPWGCLLCCSTGGGVAENVSRSRQCRPIERQKDESELSHHRREVACCRRRS